MFRALVSTALSAALLVACSDDPPAKTIYFELDADAIAESATFWNSPWPSDLRLDAMGAPDVVAFPNERHTDLLNDLLAGVPERRGWPVMSIGYFRFTAELPERTIDKLVPDTEALLVDIDATSPERGTSYPIVARTLPLDDFTAKNLVAIAPRPGVVLRAHTRYAYVIQKAFAPEFTAPAGIAALAADKTPGGHWGEAAVALYAPLWTVLDEKSIPRTDVIGATVFTTGDEVARARQRGEGVREQYNVTIDNLVLVAADTHDGFCELTGTVKLPQFQTGTPPFHTDGVFVLDGNNLPTKQSEMTVPIAITIPKGTMPANGWPLYQFFHGSGGVSTGLVDLGFSPDAGDHPEAGKGPGFVVARHGIAGASLAFPLNPERFPGAADTEYLNISNLHAFPYTFQQGVIEQRLVLDALVDIQIPAATLVGCETSTTGGVPHHFDATKLVAGGQSMGGMYTNMVGATEERYGALVPTGAGGFWNLMILETESVPGALDLLSTALDVDPVTLSFVHPALDVMAMSWEIAEPMAYMARIHHRPLDGIPARHVYQPVGKNDTYFPIDVYDAAALAYDNQQAGTEVWPSMQGALATVGKAGLATYPVKMNRNNITSVVVQFEGDGIIDAHYIYRQLETVKHQYGCFLATYLRDGVPTVPAPGALTDPCP